MNDFQEISEKQFNNAYNAHLPSKWVSFAFKYFSKETENKNLSLRNGLEYFLIGTFMLGLLGTILKLPRIVIGVFTITFTIILVGLVLYLLSAVILNRFRLKKIIKSLGITKAEYEYLVDKFNK